MKFTEGAEYLNTGSGTNGPDDPSRRNFLAKLAGGVVGVATTTLYGGIFSHPAWEFVREQLTPEEVEKGIQDRLNFLLEYGVSVCFDIRQMSDEMGDAFFKKSIEELSPAEKLDALEAMTTAIVKYPTEYIKAIKLKEIYVVNDLAVNSPNSKGESIRGLVTTLRPGLMIVEKEKKESLKDPLNYIVSGFGWKNTSDVESTFHHELFHIADPNILSPEEIVEMLKKNIEKLATGRKFIADFEKKHARPFEMPVLDSQWPGAERSIEYKGYAKMYGMKNNNEDRATVSESLFCDTKNIMDRVASDPVLAEKVRRVKEFYYGATGGIMGDEYWGLVLAGDNQKIAEYVRARGQK